MAIQLFRPRFRSDEVLDEIRQCLDAGWTGLGFKTIELETAWKEYTGLPHAHCLNSATAGLHLAISVLKSQNGWSNGDEIITTPLTFVSSNHAILYENMKPVFADVDQFLCLDPASVEACITPRTKAVIFVGLGGNTGQFQAIADLCKHKGLKLILDAAHMAGTLLDDRQPAELADVTTYSFQAVKNMPTGDLGMICFPDESSDALVRRLSWLGISKDTYSRASNRTDEKASYKWYYNVDEVGYKYHGNSVMAAIGLVSLKYLDEDNAIRRNICTHYDEAFSRAENIRSIPTAENCRSARHLYQIVVENRDQLMQKLNEHEIYPGVHYRDNLYYPMYANSDGQCPVSRYYSERILSLPLHTFLTENDIDAVVSAVKEFGELAGNAPH
ncbi:MAG: DegT/DnrJ/EryC1/StrS family aminotransferase [Pseudomonadota bacterium]